MGKSAGGAIWLRADKLSSQDYFQYFRDCSDDDVIKLLKIFTDLPLDEIKKFEGLKGEQLNPIKELLAYEATKICRGIEEAEKAKNRENITELNVKSGENIVNVLVQNSICKSNGEARRLIDGNGVKIDGENITKDFIFNKDCKIVIGKKKNFIVKISYTGGCCFFIFSLFLCNLFS